MNKIKVCCICGNEFTGWGNNPWPVKDNGECCNDCDHTYVLVARLEMLSKRKKENLL